MSRSKFDPNQKLGFNLDVPISMASLASRFVMVPFSVLDARGEEWQIRKKAWISLGIDSEVGRGVNLMKHSKGSIAVVQGGEAKAEYDRAGALSNKIKATEDVEQKEKLQHLLYKSQSRLNDIMGQKKGKKYGDFTSGPGLTFRLAGGKGKGLSGTSIFDPVLTELCYKWWCPEGGHILDPFAGGSVRGVVASVLGHPYTGGELRKEQVDANREQWDSLSKTDVGKGKPNPTWVEGDSMHIRRTAPGEYDMVFSCPPYGNLEVYSKDPNDISNMTHEQFMVNYKRIIRNSCSMLKNNRFAVFVVGEFRDKNTGFYRNFVPDTIAAFEEAGLHYYNEVILVTMVGSLPIRAGAFFAKTRKIGKTHQNVLVFYKGENTDEMLEVFGDKI